MHLLQLNGQVANPKTHQCQRSRLPKKPSLWTRSFATDFTHTLVAGYLLTTLLFVPLLAGCSAPTNTIAGLTTPQSTISGSNYVYYVNPGTRRLETGDSHITTGLLIQPNDNFSIDLDFGFLRYLQAVDPYVIVYSEVWMGKPPRPTDAQKTLNKVLLIKEGLAQNARLPQSFGHLLDPVTLTKNDVDVSVTLKVVVLSKYDNKETVQLVEGLAGVAGTVAPQWSVVAGTAAAAMKAFISQNRDKIEFEHTFTLTPLRQLPNSYVNHDSNTIMLAHDASGILREGQIAVLKGESSYRVVPYHTWYYYLWPFNWLGQFTDIPSRRFERDDHARYDALGEAIRFPGRILNSFFLDVPDFDVPSIYKPFLWVMSLLGFEPVSKIKGTRPYELGVDGGYLSFCMKAIEVRIKQIRADAKKAKRDISETEAFHQALADEENELRKPCHPITKDGAPYFSEKTHFVLRVRRTDETRGNFQTLMGESKEYLTLIREVTASRVEAKANQEQLTAEAFETAKRMILNERIQKQISEEAKKGLLSPLDEKAMVERGIKDPVDQELLIQEAVEAQVRYTTKELHEFIQLQYQSAADDQEKSKAFILIVEHIKELQKRRWDTSQLKDNKNTQLWNDGWKELLIDIAREVRRAGCTETNGCFKVTIWQQLETPVYASVFIDDAQIVEGNSASKMMTFAVHINGAPKGNVELEAAVKETGQPNSAKITEDFSADKQTIVLTKGKNTANFTVKIIGDTTMEEDEEFSVELSNLKSEDGRAVLGRAVAKGTIIDDELATVSIISCQDVLEGTLLRAKQVAIASDVPRGVPINMSFKINPGAENPAEEGKDFSTPTGNRLTLPKGEKANRVTIDVINNPIRKEDRTLDFVLSITDGPAKFSSGGSSITYSCKIPKVQ